MDSIEVTFSEDWTLLHQRLTTFGEKVVKQVTLNALRDTAVIMKKQAVSNASRSSREHRLKVDNVYINISPGNLKKYIRYGKLKNLPDSEIGYRVFVKLTTAWYAKFVEFGRSNMVANPFMRPSFEEHIDSLPVLFKEYIQMAIEEGGLS